LFQIRDVFERNRLLTIKDAATVAFCLTGEEFLARHSQFSISLLHIQAGRGYDLSE